ncbi:hypothetical protein, partial [Citrobacter freundii]
GFIVGGPVGDFELLLCHGTVCVVGKMRDLILQLSKSSIYSTKPYSGSVRKTLISSYLLAPRLTGAKFYAVETINQSASDLGIENVTSFKGDDFSRLIEG